MTSVGISGPMKPKPVMQWLELEEGMKVAELGCGSGFFALEAARIVGEKGLVYAVDILKPALGAIESKARSEGLGNIRTIWSNLEIVGATKINDEVLDYAFIFNTLFQAAKKEGLLKEAARMLKPGGKLAVMDWAKAAPGVPEPMPAEKAKKLAEGAGFKLEREDEIGSTHYGLVFIK